MKKICSLLFALALVLSGRATPYFVQLFQSDGSATNNQIGVSIWPPSDSPFVTYGTNVIYAGNVETVVLNNNGYGSNWLFPGTYRFYITNLSAAFIAVIPDTTNFLSIANYTTNLQGFSGVGLNSYGIVTNWLHFAPATNTASGIIVALGYTPANVANIGTIASRNSNDFALASSLGSIASRASNDFALAASLGTIAARSSNDFHLADGFVGLSALAGAANLSTNGGVVWVTYKTNNLPGPAFTNLPTGSLMSTTNGGFYVLSNSVWQPK